MDEGQIHRGRGLVDLIAGVTPTLVDWTNDPTDAANITDGDPSTVCTTGDKVCSAGYQYAYLEWDLGGFYDVIAGGVGFAGTTGMSKIYLHFWDGSSWLNAGTTLHSVSSMRHWANYSGNCSKVRLGLTATSASTVTPDIREFHVWRL